MRNTIKNLLMLITLGGVSVAEAASAVEATAPCPGAEQRQARMKAHWDKIDTNHDGKLSRAEAQQGALKLVEHFDKMDANGDGQLTPMELREARRARQAARAAEPRAGG